MEKNNDFKEQATYYLLRRTYANMRIAICDDDQNFLNKLKEHIYCYAQRHHYETVVSGFTSGEDLLPACDGFNVIFMDYKMGGIDGLETARILRRQNANCAMIFLTGYPEIVYDVFEVGTFRFLQKPLDLEKLNSALDGYFRMYGNDYPILLSIDRDSRCVETKNIISLESKGKICIVNIRNKDSKIEQLRCAKTMKAVYEQMPKHFCRAHHSFIVNMNYVESIKNKEIHLTTGQTAFTSRRYHVSFKNTYIGYIKNKNIG